MQNDFETWNDKKPNLMMEWLGLGSTVFLQRETENMYGNEGEAFVVTVLQVKT